jgi:DNA primase
MEAAGVLARSDRGDDDVYDRFRGRLMFPIRDELGRVIAFSGRIIEKDQHPAKYVNSPETAIFKKGRILYALDRARRPILESRTALVCEGQIDVIRCHGAGLTTAVAGLGTALTEDHARLLKRYADSAVLVMDADAAGQNSAIRTAEIFIAGGLSVRVAALPPGEDPDSLILKHGPTEIERLIETAKSALDFHMDVLLAREDVKTEAGLLRVTRTLLESISRAPSAVQREQLIHQASARLNVSEDALRKDLPKKYQPQTRNPEPQKIVPIVHPAEEVELARVLAHHPECVDLVRQFMPLMELSDAVCRTIVGHLLEDNLDFTMDGDESGRLVAEILATDSKMAGSEATPEEAAKDLILKIRRKTLELRRKTLEEQRSQATGPERERLHAELAQLILDLRALKDGWEKARPVLEIHAG